ncbi:MAG TPA: porin [Gallionella sp.]|nr:porin [Gallionella sp.]
MRLALSLLLALPGIAAAETGNVTLYGVANLSYELVSLGTGTAGTPAVTGPSNVNKVSSNASRLGLKGTEDLGDGLSAVWQVESLIAMDNAGGTFGTRNTYAGLDSKDWGRLVLGRYDTPYNTTTRRLDWFIDTIADSQPLMGGTTGISATLGFAARQTDSVLYVSPVISGFTGTVQYANTAEGNTSAAQPKSSLLSMAGWYSEGPTYAALAHEIHYLNSLTGGREDAWKLTLGYTPERFGIGFAVETTRDNLAALGGNQWGHHAYYLSGKYLIGKDAVKAAYTSVGQLGTTANTDARQYTLGYDHTLSVRTTLYALYTRLHNGPAINYGLSSASSGGGANTIVAPGSGASPSAWSFGIKHIF